MIKVIIPKTGADMEEAQVVSWRKNEGERVNKGEVLLEIETDKAIMEVESPEAGVLLKRFYSEGDSVPATNTVAVLGEGGESPDAVARFASSEEGGTGAARAAAGTVPTTEQCTGGLQASQPSASEASGSAGDARRDTPGERAIKASPAARRLAKDKGIGLAGIQGSGPGGRIEKEDVARAADSGSSSASSLVAGATTSHGALPHGAPPSDASASDTVIPLAGMRRAIARRMTESKREAPDFSLTIAIDMTKAIEARARLKAAGQAGRIVTINDQVIHAVSRALAKHPTLNARFEGEAVRCFAEANVGFAIGTDDGLFVPVVRSAQKKTLEEIAAETRQLTEKARARRLSETDLSGGTFTVSNLGMYGIESFTAIINPPQAAILAVGGIADEPSRGADGGIVWRPTMRVTLSADHRVVDGLAGAMFLAELKSLIGAA